jgi:hypothetical protein
VNPVLEQLAEQAADLHASQQAMPDEGALEEHRRLIREAYELGWETCREQLAGGAQ